MIVSREKVLASAVIMWAPSLRMVILSEISSASSSAWLMKMIETCSLRSRSIRANRWCFSSGVKVAVGSSKMMTFALRRTARAFDHLPLRGAERLDDHRRIDRKVQRRKQLLRLDIGSPQAVEELLVTQIEVLRDRQRGNETRLLVDHCDPVAPRAGRTGNLYS